MIQKIPEQLEIRSELPPRGYGQDREEDPARRVRALSVAPPVLGPRRRTIDREHPYRIVFVCTGNICRSPMAAAMTDAMAHEVAFAAWRPPQRRAGSLERGHRRLARRRADGPARRARTHRSRLRRLRTRGPPVPRPRVRRRRPRRGPRPSPPPNPAFARARACARRPGRPVAPVRSELGQRDRRRGPLLRRRRRVRALSARHRGGVCAPRSRR